MTPLEKWKRGLEGKAIDFSITPKEPANGERFRQDFLPFVDPDGLRAIEKDGVHFKDIPYWADELRALQNEHGLKERYLVRFDPTDVRVLHIFDGTHNVYYK